jgi:hypothetical protein
VRRTTRGIDGGTPSGASPESAPVVDALEIAIAATNGLRFSPAAVTIPARVPVRIDYTNQTAVYHDLVIPELARRTSRIGPDDDSSLCLVHTAVRSRTVPGFLQGGGRVPACLGAGVLALGS